MLRGLVESIEDKRQPTFHLVLVFKPTNDLTRGKAGPDSGMLVGTYWKQHNALIYLPNGNGPRDNVAPDLEGCHAHVITMQRITALSESEENELKAVATFTDLLTKAFPNQDNGAKESLIRFLPEFLGPIPIVNKVT